MQCGFSEITESKSVSGRLCWFRELLKCFFFQPHSSKHSLLFIYCCASLRVHVVSCMPAVLCVALRGPMDTDPCGPCRFAGLRAISARTRSDKLHIKGRGEWRGNGGVKQQQAVTFGTVTVQ